MRKHKALVLSRLQCLYTPCGQQMNWLQALNQSNMPFEMIVLSEKHNATIEPESGRCSFLIQKNLSEIGVSNHVILFILS